MTHEQILKMRPGTRVLCKDMRGLDPDMLLVFDHITFAGEARFKRDNGKTWDASLDPIVPTARGWKRPERGFEYVVLGYEGRNKL